jgi:predicted nucleotidyltransferase
MRSTIAKILDALNRAEVRYLVVGGVAVLLHGYVRMTKDLDLVIQLEPDNIRRAMAVLRGLGFQPMVPVAAEAFTDPETRERWAREKNMTVFSLQQPDRPLLPVDLFVTEPFDFNEVYARRAVFQFDGIEASVVPLGELVRLKSQVGRLQDLADLDGLSKLGKIPPRE